VIYKLAHNLVEALADALDVNLSKPLVQILEPEEVPLIKPHQAKHLPTCGTHYRGCAPDCHVRALEEGERGWEKVEEARAFFTEAFKQQGNLVWRYTDCLDRLRNMRRLHAPDAVLDAIYDEMDDLWDEMTQAQKAEVEKLSWRAFPDSYDEAVNAPKAPEEA
jgi:hypothetical protein